MSYFTHRDYLSILTFTSIYACRRTRGGIKAYPEHNSKSLLILFHFVQFIPCGQLLNFNTTYSLIKDDSMRI